MKKFYLKNKVTAILLLIVVTFTACGQAKKEAKVPPVPKAVAENLATGKTFTELVEKAKQPGTIPSSAKNSFYSLVQEQKMLARNSLNTKDFSADTVTTTESANPTLVSGILSLDSTQADTIYPNPVFYKNSKVCSNETVDNKVKRLGAFKDNNTLMINHNLATISLVDATEYKVFAVILLPNKKILWLNGGDYKDKLKFTLMTDSDKITNKEDLGNDIGTPDDDKIAITASGSNLKKLASETLFKLNVDLISYDDNLYAGDYEVDLVFLPKTTTTTWDNAIIAPFNFTYAKKECLKTTANTDGSKKVESPGFTTDYNYFLTHYTENNVFKAIMFKTPDTTDSVEFKDKIFTVKRLQAETSSILPIAISHCNFTEAQVATWTSTQATDIKKAREQLSWSKILNGNICETMVYISEEVENVVSSKKYMVKWIDATTNVPSATAIQTDNNCYHGADCKCKDSTGAEKDYCKTIPGQGYKNGETTTYCPNGSVIQLKCEVKEVDATTSIDGNKKYLVKWLNKDTQAIIAQSIGTADTCGAGAFCSANDCGANYCGIYKNGDGGNGKDDILFCLPKDANGNAIYGEPEKYLDSNNDGTVDHKDREKIKLECKVTEIVPQYVVQWLKKDTDVVIASNIQNDNMCYHGDFCDVTACGGTITSCGSYKNGEIKKTDGSDILDLLHNHFG